MAAPAASFTVIPLSDVDPDSPCTTGLFVSYRDNIENVFAQLVGDPVGTPTFTPAAEHDHDGVNSKTVPGADFILVEKKLITSDVQDFDFSGLDGNTDEVYKLVGRIIVTGGHKVTLRPNAISTNQASRFIQSASSGTSGDLLLANSQTATDRLYTFEAIFWAKNNPNSIAVDRVLHSQYTFNSATIPQTDSPGFSGAVWNETATNVTSLRIHSAVASGLRDGSTIALYKLRQ